jgi:hypothetical protein
VLWAGTPADDRAVSTATGQPTIDEGDQGRVAPVRP